MSERVSLASAAAELGVHQQLIRENMKNGLWDLGSVTLGKKCGKKKNSYFIYRDKLNRHMGKTPQKEA